MKYTINYNTGAGNETIEADDIGTVQGIADVCAAYTQQPITIEDMRGNIISRREWCQGNAVDLADYSDPISYGDFGFFADWDES